MLDPEVTPQQPDTYRPTESLGHSIDWELIAANESPAIAPPSARGKNYLIRLSNRSERFAAALTIASVVLGPAIDHADINLRLLAASAKAIVDPTEQISEHGSTSGAAIQNMEDTYGLGGGFYKKDPGPSPSGIADMWTVYQIGNAYLLRSLLPGAKDSANQPLAQTVQAASNYWGTSPQGAAAGYDPTINTIWNTKPQERFVDDNLWMSELLMHLYASTGDKTYLERATQIQTMAMSQWKKDGGGIYWMEQLPGEANHDRALVSNAPMVTLSAMLYLNSCRQVCNPKYLEDAKNVFAWIQQNLYDPATGLFFDHLEGNGEISKAFYTYGQGAVINAILSLHAIAPEEYPLQMAVNLANNSMKYFLNTGGYGIAKFDNLFGVSLMELASQYNDPAFTEKVMITRAKIKAAMPDKPISPISSAAAVSVLSLNELPFERWSRLGALGTINLLITNS